MKLKGIINQKNKIRNIIKEENESDENASKRWWNCYRQREDSLIVDLFHGQYKSTISCNDCHRVCVSFDSYMFISLPIPTGKYEIDIKYFGYHINNFFIMKIPITENTTVLNIIDIISNRLNKMNNNMSNPLMQQAKIPHKKIKVNHQTKTLFEYSSQTLKQHHFLYQQSQLNTQATILTKAQKINIIYKEIFREYSEIISFLLLFAISINVC